KGLRADFMLDQGGLSQGREGAAQWKSGERGEAPWKETKDLTGPVAESRGTRCSLRGSCPRISRTCSDRFAVAAPQTRLYALPLRSGPIWRHPRECNGSFRYSSSKRPKT